jgi:acetolactate synthase-1/2/3 large subunit
MSGAEGVVEVLVQAGVRYVFGIPGGDAGRIFKALNARSDDIRTIVVHHESVASAMAETMGRLTGVPGVLVGQGPWVLGLGVLGLLEAKLSSSPLLVLTDFSDSSGFAMHGAYQVGTGDYGGWDARLSFLGLTKRVIEARNPRDAVQGTQLAVKHAMSGERGPVAVLFSGASLTDPLLLGAGPRLYATPRYIGHRSFRADPTHVQRAAEALLAAERPVIIAGNGVRIGMAYVQLRELAEALSLPVVTTPSGKGCFDESDVLAYGVFGTIGTTEANQVVSEADLILVVGSKLSASDTAYESSALIDPDRQTIIQIDVEPLNVSWALPAHHQLIGDAASVLAQLQTEVSSSLVTPRSPASGAGTPRHRRARREPVAVDDEAGIDPRTLVGAIQRAIGYDSTVVCDAGENRIFMTHYFESRVEGFLQAAGAGPMGYAIPSAMAAKLCYPERRVVAVTGDGGFAMTMNALLTALEEGIAISVVIFNNAALGWSLHGGSLKDGRRRVDFASVARAMGCTGIKVAAVDELDRSLIDCFQSGDVTPTVVDVDVSLAISFQDITSPLARNSGRKP